MGLLFSILKLLLVIAGLAGVCIVVVLLHRAYKSLKNYLSASIARHDQILTDTKKSVVAIETSTEKFIKQLKDNDKKLRTHMMKLTGEVAEVKKEVSHINRKVGRLAVKVNVNPEELNDKS